MDETPIFLLSINSMDGIHRTKIQDFKQRFSNLGISSFSIKTSKDVMNFLFKYHSVINFLTDEEQPFLYDYISPPHVYCASSPTVQKSKDRWIMDSWQTNNLTHTPIKFIQNAIAHQTNCSIKLTGDKIILYGIGELFPDVTIIKNFLNDTKDKYGVGMAKKLSCSIILSTLYSFKQKHRQKEHYINQLFDTIECIQKELFVEQSLASFIGSYLQEHHKQNDTLYFGDIHNTKKLTTLMTRLPHLFWIFSWSEKNDTSYFMKNMNIVYTKLNQLNESFECVDKNKNNLLHIICHKENYISEPEEKINWFLDYHTELFLCKNSDGKTPLDLFIMHNDVAGKKMLAVLEKKIMHNKLHVELRLLNKNRRI